MGLKVERVQLELVLHRVNLQDSQIVWFGVCDVFDELTKRTVAVLVVVEARPMQKRFAALRTFLRLAAFVAHVPHQIVLSGVAGTADGARKSTALSGSQVLRLRIPVASVVQVSLQKARPSEALATALANVRPRSVSSLKHRSIPLSAAVAFCNRSRTSIRTALVRCDFTPG